MLGFSVGMGHKACEGDCHCRHKPGQQHDHHLTKWLHYVKKGTIPC